MLFLYITTIKNKVSLHNFVSRLHNISCLNHKSEMQELNIFKIKWTDMHSKIIIKQLEADIKATYFIAETLVRDVENLCRCPVCLPVFIYICMT